MNWGITFVGEWQEMKKKMDLVWKNFFEEGLEGKEELRLQWVEKFPKPEGTGKTSSRSNKHTKQTYQIRLAREFWISLNREGQQFQEEKTGRSEPSAYP